MDTVFEESFADRLSELRSQYGISAREMSLSLGQSEGYINGIENGKGFPSMTMFFEICNYLHVTPAEFFDIEVKDGERIVYRDRTMARVADRSDFDVLKKIDDERVARGWSEYMLAKRAGLTQSTISSWYQKGLQPSISSLEKICKAFGMTLSGFFKTDEKTTDMPEKQQELNVIYERLSPGQRDAVVELMKNM